LFPHWMGNQEVPETSWTALQQYQPANIVAKYVNNAFNIG